MKITAYRRGILSEERAASLLEKKGFKVLAKRFKVPAGEVDIVAQQDTLLIFVEVKFRRTMTEALETISLRQQRRILAAAEVFLQQYPALLTEFIRFDVIALTVTAWQHIEGAFWQDLPQDDMIQA